MAFKHSKNTKEAISLKMKEYFKTNPHPRGMLGKIPWNKGKKGLQKHPLKNKGRGWINNKGYKVMKMDGKDIKEHRYVWEQYYGLIPKGHDIHHRNGIKDDNKIENLEIINTSEHAKLHHPRGIQIKNRWPRNG